MLNKKNGKIVIVSIENDTNFFLEDQKNMLIEELNHLKCAYVRFNDEACGFKAEFESGDKLLCEQHKTILSKNISESIEQASKLLKNATSKSIRCICIGALIENDSQTRDENKGEVKELVVKIKSAYSKILLLMKAMKIHKLIDLSDYANEVIEYCEKIESLKKYLFENYSIVKYVDNKRVVYYKPEDRKKDRSKSIESQLIIMEDFFAENLKRYGDKEYFSFEFQNMEFEENKDTKTQKENDEVKEENLSKLNEDKYKSRSQHINDKRENENKEIQDKLNANDNKQKNENNKICSPWRLFIAIIIALFIFRELIDLDMKMEDILVSLGGFKK